MLTRLLPIVLIAALASVSVSATSVAATSKSDARQKNYGEQFVFLGWSKDNLYVAYTLDRLKRPLGPKKPPRVRIRHLMRRVYRGHLGGMGPVHGSRLKPYIRRHGYEIHPLTVTSVKKHLWRIDTPSDPIHLKVEAKKLLTWTLFSDAGTLAEGTLNRPYIRFEPRAYLSPNGKMILLGMQVHTGWYEDAVIQTANLDGK
jgi:hypothetical protein